MQQQRHNQMMRRAWSIWDTMSGGDMPPEPLEMELKTKKYHAPPIEELDPDMDPEEDPSTCCTICFVPLEEGDRIGALTCDHVYHVDCLKVWVQRKNSCPLCATPLATIRKPPNERPQDEQSPQQSSSSSSDGSSGSSDSSESSMEERNPHNI